MVPCLQVEMDGSHFAKLCRECGLVGGKLTTTAVDIAFSKAKNKARQLPLAVRRQVSCKQGLPLQAALARVADACLHEVQTAEAMAVSGSIVWQEWGLPRFEPKLSGVTPCLAWHPLPELVPATLSVEGVT